MKTSDIKQASPLGSFFFARLFLLLLLTVPFTGCSTKPKTPAIITGEKSRATGFLTQGNKQFDAGLYGAAFESYKKSLALFGAINENEGVVDTLLAMVRVEIVTGKEKEASDLIDYAQSYAGISGDPKLVRRVLNTRSEYLLKKGDFEDALTLCLDTTTPGLSLQSEEAAGMYRIRGKAFNRLAKYQEAEESLKKALSIDTTLMHKGDQAADYYVLASIYSLSGKYKEALAAAEKALSLDKDIESMTGIASDLSALAAISEKSGNTDKALAYWNEAYLAWRGLGRDTEKAEAAAAIRRLSDNSSLFLP